MQLRYILTAAVASLFLLVGPVYATENNNNNQDHTCQGGNNCNDGGAGDSSNTNENTNQQQQGQAQGQLQGQGQAQGQQQTAKGGKGGTGVGVSFAISEGSDASSSSSSSSSSSASANNRLNNVGNASVYMEDAENPVSTARAPDINPTSPCMGSSSAGGQGMSVGLSFGTSWRDIECEKREAVRLAVEWGHPDAVETAMKVFNSMDVVKAVQEEEAAETAANLPSLYDDAVADAGWPGQPKTLP